MALIGHPVVNDKQYTYGFAAQMLRAGSAAECRGQDARGNDGPCEEAQCDAEACVPDEVASSCSQSSNSSQVECLQKRDGLKQKRPTWASMGHAPADRLSLHAEQH